MVGDHKMQTNKDRGGVTSMGASTQIELGVSRLIGVCVCVCVVQSSVLAPAILRHELVMWSKEVAL